MVADALAAHDATPTPVYDVAKRTLDIVVSATLIVLTLPIIGLLSLVIRMQSPGPAVFRQRRVGRDGRVIRFYKFRTMYSDARERFPELYDYRFTAEQFATSYYKPPVDPRNTPFGRALRKTTLDELPNLFNVIKGDVSLVGPRPELPELIEYYSPQQLTKFSVKSGITGLAQVSGRNNLSIQEQIALDVQYVQTRSFLRDLKLIALTAIMVVKRVGAE
jgi:lipopolysaccharide/colanic/teichoic acid biosynthesis glycosyltransferase